MMIFLELFQPIFELQNVKPMVGVEVADPKVLRHFFFLIKYLLDLSPTSHRFIQGLLHYFITIINASSSLHYFLALLQLANMPFRKVTSKCHAGVHYTFLSNY